MRMSEKQKQMLFQIAYDSVDVPDVQGSFKIPGHERVQLVQAILDQQSDRPIDEDDVGGQIFNRWLKNDIEPIECNKVTCG